MIIPCGVSRIPLGIPRLQGDYGSITAEIRRDAGEIPANRRKSGEVDARERKRATSLPLPDREIEALKLLDHHVFQSQDVAAAEIDQNIFAILLHVAH